MFISISTSQHCPAEVDCGDLDAPDDGTVNMPNGTQFQDTATYSCSDGFELFEETLRICQDSGEWSGVEPVCVIEESEGELVHCMFAVHTTSLDLRLTPPYNEDIP